MGVKMNQTINNTISGIECLQKTYLGDVVLVLAVWGMISLILIIILLIIIFKLLEKNKGDTKSQNGIQ